MKYIPFFLSATICLLFTNRTYAQTGGDQALSRIKNSTPIPPDAAAFQKYSYYPVSLSTGVVNISIPLLTIKSGELEQHISLDYHTGGIQVNERATKQGLGWLLNAGGMINRSIQGANADENPFNGYLIRRSLLPAANNPSITNMPFTGFPNGYPTMGFQDTLMAIAKPGGGGWDMEPDLFTYKFGDKSGVFYFSTTGNIVNEGQEPIKIESTDNLQTFKITDENGIVYLFEISQTSDPHSSSQIISGSLYNYSFGAVNPDGSGAGLSVNSTPNIPPYGAPTKNLIYPITTGWNLTRIIHPNMVDTIYFDYNQKTFVISQVSGQSLEYPYAVNGDLTSTPSPGGPGILETTSTSTDQGDNELYRIRYAGNTITFNYAADRQDINVPQDRLSTVVSTDAKGNLLQTITVDNNAYFNGTNGQISNGSSFASLAPDTKRLKLNGVIFSNALSNNSYSYRFKYNEQALPMINATSQDYWGYYNGQNGNQNLIPQMSMSTPFNGTQYPNYNTIVGSANRTADNTNMQAFSLTEVDYPTGGMTRFEYSAHRILSPVNPAHNITIGGLKVDRIKLYNDTINLQNYMVKHYVYGYGGQQGYGFLTSNKCAEYSFGWKQTYVPYDASRNLLGVTNPLCVNIITVSSSPVHNYDIPGYSAVVYDQVQEIEEDVNGKTNGYRLTKFSHSGNPTVFSQTTGTLPLNGTQHPDAYTDYPSDLGGTGSIYDTHDVDNVNMMNGTYTHLQFCPQKAFYPITNRPLLISESTYDTSGNLLVLDSKTYTSSILATQHVIGLSVNTMIGSVPSSSPVGNAPAYGFNITPGGNLYYPTQFNYFLYEIPIGTNKIASETKTTYTPGQSTSVTQTTNYVYEPVNGLLRKSTTTNSAGKPVVYENWYPFDYSNSIPAIDSLNTRHILSAPVFNQKVVGGETVKATINQYDGVGNLASTYLLNQEAPYLVQSPSVVAPASGFDKQYDLHYSNARLVRSTYKNLTNTAYQWGYNNQYPVAKVSNATDNDIFYDSFEEGDGNGVVEDSKTGHYSHTGTYSKVLSGLDNGAYILSYWQKSGTAWTLQTNSVTVSNGTYTISLSVQVDDIRFYPSQAQMITYTYDPLIGITSSTDIKGIVSYYEYDSFQRLMNIKDKDGNITKHVDYHYQGQ